MPPPVRYTTKHRSKLTQDSASPGQNISNTARKAAAVDSAQFASTPRFRTGRRTSLSQTRTPFLQRLKNDYQVQHDEPDSPDAVQTRESKRQRLSPEAESGESEPGHAENDPRMLSSAVTRPLSGGASSKRRFITRPITQTRTEPERPAMANSHHSPLQHRHRSAFIFPSPSQSTSTSSRRPYIAQNLPSTILLNQTFSPHRPSKRTGGDRFVVGGWAAQVREWVVDLAHSPAGLQHGGAQESAASLATSFADTINGPQLPGYSDGQVILQVEELNIATTDASRSAATAFILAQGKVVQGGAYNQTVLLCLVGHGSALPQHSSGLDPVRPPEARVGSRVVVKAPVWEVELSGKTWIMAVDWLML